MTDPILEAPLLSRTDPALARPLPAAIARARTDVIAAARDLLAIPGSRLADPWTWIGRGGEVEIRDGAYRAAEALEKAEVEARAGGAAVAGAAVAGAAVGAHRAADLVGPSTAARWDLHGLLLALDDRLLDADPGAGEWTIRLTLGHIISGQRGYGWGSAWWLQQGLALTDPDLPPGAPESLWDALPDEATTEAAGSIEDLRARLDASLDLTTERLAGIPDDRVDLGSRWSGFPVTLGFRFGRWGSHIREHTIQVEKTLAMLGHVPDEPARLARHVLAGYGRAEAVVFGQPGAEAAAERIAQGATEARTVINEARTAAGA